MRKRSMWKKLSFFKAKETRPDQWNESISDDRIAEDMYRQRYSYDKVVRTTHGVNCTGSCSWKVFVNINTDTRIKPMIRASSGAQRGSWCLVGV